MSLLNRPMLWLRQSTLLAAALGVAAPALASPATGSTAHDRPASAEELPKSAAAHQGPQLSPTLAQNQPHPSAPGQFEVDEDAAERALERTLVVQGALLLPFGLAEIQPSFTYMRNEADALNLAIQQGTPLLLQRDVRRNVLTANLFVRVGLPFDSQLELGLPYRYIDSEQVTDISGLGRNTSSTTSAGFGDFRIGAAKALLHEGLWWPNLIGRVAWDTDSGRTNASNPLGSGFNELTGSLTATKRQDPLVFIGSMSYTTSFEKNGVEPGDQLGFSAGALLAASPETSLRLILDQTFRDEAKVNGQTIKGSDQVIASLGFGASSIIGHGKFLDFLATTGLTDQASDYSVGVTLVIRFDVPHFPF